MSSHLSANWAKSPGIPGVVLDESGMVTLVLGDAPRLVNLGFNAPAGTLDLMLCLDEVVPTASQLSRLMAANFGWTATLGAVLALKPTLGALVVQRRCGEERRRAAGWYRLSRA